MSSKFVHSLFKSPLSASVLMLLNSLPRVPFSHPIWIQHWNYHKNEMFPQFSWSTICAYKLFNYSLHDKTTWWLSWVNSWSKKNYSSRISYTIRRRKICNVNQRTESVVVSFAKVVKSYKISIEWNWLVNFDKIQQMGVCVWLVIC